MNNDHDTARELANAAGELLLEIRAEHQGAEPKTLRELGDRGSHELLMSLLAQRCPDDAVLSEEGTDDSVPRGVGRAWIVDPLDGTREFSEGRNDWAVHVALVADGRLAAGAVAIPGTGATYTTGTSASPASEIDRPIRLAVSRTRPSPVSESLAQQLGGELVPMGSAGVKAIAVLTGEVDAYVHSGGQYVWDSAAPVAVVTSAGLHASRLDGTPLTYGTETTWLPDLLVCRPQLADRILTSIAALAA